MKSFEELKQSTLWDKTYDLPLFPDYNNPHVYCAYVLKYYRDQIKEEELRKIQAQKSSFTIECAVDYGLFYRWPNERGLETSHDELIGIAYADEFRVLSRHCAEWIYGHYGYYNNRTKTPTGIKDFFRWNLYRFPWAIAYINHRAYGSCNYFLKICFSLHVILKSFQSPEKASGHLLIWLMSEEMNKSFTCRQAIKLSEWIKRVSKRDYSIENLFRLHFPKEEFFR